MKIPSFSRVPLIWGACVVATLLSVHLVMFGSAFRMQAEGAHPDGKGQQVGDYVCPQYQQHRQVATMKCDFEDVVHYINSHALIYDAGFLLLVVLPVFVPLSAVFYGYVFLVNHLVGSAWFRKRNIGFAHSSFGLFVLVVSVTTLLQTVPFWMLQMITVLK